MRFGFPLNGQGGVDSCGRDVAPVARERALVVAPGATIRITVKGWTITDADSAERTRSSAMGNDDDPYSEVVAITLVDGVPTFQAPSSGDWHIRVSLAPVVRDGDEFFGPFDVRIVVKG